MSPHSDRSAWHLPAGALVAVVCVALLAFVAGAAIQPRVGNPHGKFKEDCQLCHTARAWNEVSVSRKFDHAKYGFALSGSHLATNCTGCHTTLDFAQSKTQCASCHQDPHRGEMGTDCARCHGARSFQDRGPMVRAHQLSRFPLTGGHATVDCESCHVPAAQGRMQFVGTRVECYGCHQAQYDAAPNHKAGNFSRECQGCHTTIGWTKASGFDHAAAGFPLTGNHSTSVRACDDCHHGNYATTSAACETCHLNSTPGYANTGPGNPTHNTANFPYAQCRTCHASAAAGFTSWQGGTYTHATMQLTNAHSGRACEDCHAGNYASVAFSCIGCHQFSTPGYANATNPPHTPAYFPTDNAKCQSCHTTVSFQPSTWPSNHSTTTFAASFRGAHLAVACADCHNPVSWATPATGNNCIGCHAADYANATPPHDPVNNPQPGCACHNLTSWANATAFDHASVGFQTIGQHSLTARQCADCHNIIGYTPQPADQDCITCHLNSSPGYANTGPGKPAHNATYFPSATAQCTTCHAAAAAGFTSWQGGTYTHATMQLTNAHSGRACEDCHAGNYTSVAYSCYGCHQNSVPGYANATNPPHTPAYFPIDNAKCQSCHTTVAFQPSTWPSNHSTTAFAASFSGAHLAVACTDCHNQVTWVTPATGNNCIGCHAADYANATPPHDPVNYPQAGCACHNLTSWANATAFDHASVGFQTIGQHSLTARQCADCHDIIGYTPQPNDQDCITCHLNSSPGYANTGPGKPVHNATYFPSATAQCTTCHTAAAAGFTSWQGGTYTHATMQLTNAHSGRACEDCHAGNYTSVAFSCYGCHQNSVPGYANATNPPHTPAYFPIDNAKCQSCHTTVAFQPSTWPSNHSTTAFAASFSGAHLAVACTDCHNQVTWATPATGNNCIGCHSTDYANATPPHDPVNYPQAGCACHNLTSWANATAFDHASVGFSMTGQHALAARQCADCHTLIGYTPQPADLDCITCHAAAYNSNGVLIHTAPNFPSATAQCITCHAAANTNHTTWNDGSFAAHANVTTNFALTGNHAGIPCSDCHTAPTTDLKQYTCNVACHTSSDFLDHPARSCNGTTFAAAKATGTIKACYTCHPRGTRSTSGC